MAIDEINKNLNKIELNRCKLEQRIFRALANQGMLDGDKYAKQIMFELASDSDGIEYRKALRAAKRNVIECTTKVENHSAASVVESVYVEAFRISFVDAISDELVSRRQCGHRCDMGIRAGSAHARL